MLADARSRAADFRFTSREPSGRFRLPHPPDAWLIELGDQFPRDDLLVADDFAAPKDRRARHIISIEPLQPFRR